MTDDIMKSDPLISEAEIGDTGLSSESCVMPVPSGVADPEPVHPTLGSPSACWRYRDVTGALLGEVCRFDLEDGRKEIRPRTYWSTGKTGEWQWKSFPEPRPLFGLDQLVARPDSPVLIVEGEKAAVGLDFNGGAAALLPAHVVMTSPGGANAANKADWIPLRHRDVVIWPDADEAGERYAKAVVDRLRAVGARSVRVVSVDGLPECFDLGDPLPPELNVHERIAAARDMPVYISHGRFAMQKDGLYVETDSEDASDMVRVSDPFEILGRVRNPDGIGWAKWLRFRDADGRVQEYDLPDADLHGDPAILCKALADRGLTIVRGQRGNLADYLNQVPVAARISRVPKTGWHHVGGQRVFVLPDQVIGNPAERVVLAGVPHGPYNRKGTVADWRDSVGRLTAGHARAVAVISAAFAGPVLSLLGLESGGIHLYGRSSRGKTTALQAAASVWGPGAADPGFVASWSATANALEGRAALHSDTVLMLDEIGVADSRSAGAAIYRLSSGIERGRAKRNGTLRQHNTWKILIVSTGEEPIGSKVTENGNRIRAGQEVRMLDIPADAGKGFGVFDHAGPNGDAERLARDIKAAASTYYGTAGPAFVARLIAEGEEAIGMLREMVDAFCERCLPPNADGQVRRATQRLALIGAAGELARFWGLVPWTKGEAIDAAERLLNAWIASRGGVGASEERAMISQVRRFVEEFGESRFDLIDGAFGRELADERRALYRAGWRRAGDDGSREWLFTPETWKEVCKGFDPTEVARVLWTRGMLTRDENGGKFSRSERTPYGSKRVYVITEAILANDDET